MKANILLETKFRVFQALSAALFVISIVSLTSLSSWAALDPSTGMPEVLSVEEKQMLKSSFHRSFPTFEINNGKINAPMNSDNRILIMAYLNDNQSTLRNTINKIMQLNNNPEIIIYKSEILMLSNDLQLETMNFNFSERNSLLSPEKTVQNNYEREVSPYLKKQSSQKFAAFIGIPTTSLLLALMNNSIEVLMLGLAAEAYYLHALSKTETTIVKVTKKFRQLLQVKLNERINTENHMYRFIESLEETIREANKRSYRCNGLF